MKATIALFLCFGLLSGSLSFTRPALAADAATEKARQHFLKGQQYFDVGRWDEAAEQFEQAYAARNDPIFIYNMAQAYRRKGESKRALELYKNYLIKAPKSPQRAEVEERIAALQRQIDEAPPAVKVQEAAPAAASVSPAAAPVIPPPAAIVPSPQPAPSATSETAPVAAPAPAPTAAPLPTGAQPPAPYPYAAPAASTSSSPPAYVQTSLAPSPPAAAPGRGMRIGGVVCGATGLLALGVGIFFGLEATDYASSVEKSAVFQPSYDDRGKLYQSLQWVGYGVGAGLLATGVALYGIGAASAKTPAVALVPTILPGGAGLGAKGTF